MATLLNAVTSDTDGSGAAHNGPSTVWIIGDLDGGRVEILGAPTDTAAQYKTLGLLGQARADNRFNAVLYGSHYLKAKLTGAGANANVTVITTQ